MLDLALPAKIQALEKLLVALGFTFREVIQEFAPTGDHAKQTAPRRKVLLVLAHVLRQVLDALRQFHDLHVGASCIAIVELEIGCFLNCVTHFVELDLCGLSLRPPVFFVLFG